MRYLVLLMLLGSCGKVAGYSPKFKEGDCIDSPEKTEFSGTVHDYNKILKVGKQNYLYLFSTTYNLTSELSIKFMDENYIKVDCKEAGF